MRRYRRGLWIDNVRQDLRLAVRAMRRRPAFALSTVFTLGVAIALTASAYGIVHAYLVRPLPYAEADRLVRIRLGPTRDQFPNLPSFERVNWSVADSVFEQTVAWNPDAFTVTGSDRTESVHGAWVSQGYFTSLGLRPGTGRAFEPREHADNAPVVILSDALWSRLFARDPSVIGRAVRVQSLESPGGAELATVVGIMPRNSWHIDRFTDVLRPLPHGPRFPLIARLERGMSIPEAERRLNAVVLPQLGKVDPAFRLSLGRVQDDYTFRLRPTLVALMGGAVFLLLIAAANVAGAQTARAASRRAEIQVRLALGATRARITMQLLTESLVIAMLAAVIGAAIAGVTLTTFGAVVGDQLGAAIPGGSDGLAPNAGMLMLVVSGGALVGAVFGLLPAIVIARGVPAGEHAGRSLGAERGSVRSQTSPVLRRGLIVAQVAFTMMLLVGAGLMGRTIMAIAITPLGFDDEGVVKGDLFMPPARYENPELRRAGVERLIAEVAAAPGVQRAASAFPDPLRTFILPPVGITSDASSARAEVERPAASYIVTPGYFEVMRIPLKSGRTFTRQDAGGSVPTAIVSEELARQLWPGGSGIGRRVRASDDSVWRTVVGVVGETRQPVEAASTAEVYLPYAQNPMEMISILARITREPAEVGMALQRAVTRVDDGLGLGTVRPLSDLTARLTRRHHTLASILSVFALLALGLAMLGLYASLAYVVAQRRREIAIRVAVGAGAWAVRRLVAREGVALVVVGLLGGTALSLSLTRLLGSQLYGVTPTDLATFAAIASLLGASALVAALAPLRQAARVSPAEIMRSE
jgi:putative ABC transport system permease protein